MSLTAVLLIGAVFGAIVQRTHFCTMGAMADLVLFGGTRRLRAWLLALALALAGTQLLIATGRLDPAATMYGRPPLGWLALFLGGLAFGFGMVLGGGCFSRNLVRIASGSLKALLTTLLAAAAAAVTWQGALALLRTALAEVPPQGLPNPGPLGTVLGLALAAGLAAWCLSDAAFRRSRRDLAAAIGLGPLPPLLWLALGTDVQPGAEGGLTFSIPAARLLAGLDGSPLPGFAIALFGGVLLGAFLAAASARQLRLEGFAGRDDLLRNLAGGLLMGLGGGLAAGCSIGHGLTGLALLAPGSAIAMAGMAAGAAWALRWLATGRLQPFAAAR